MKISELTNGMMVKYRLGMAGKYNVIWQPWKEGDNTSN